MRPQRRFLPLAANLLRPPVAARPVLERTSWHAAQHLRQVYALLEAAGADSRAAPQRPGLCRPAATGLRSGKIPRRRAHATVFLSCSNASSQTLRKDRLDRVLLALVVITSVAGMLGMAYFDSLPLGRLTVVDDCDHYHRRLWGYLSPASLGGRVVGVLLMLFGIGFLGLLTATLASIFVEERRQEEKGVNSSHVSLSICCMCGWNYKAKEIVAEIRANDTDPDTRPVVLIAELAEKPLEDDEQVHFVSGPVTQESLDARQTLSTPKRPLSYPMRSVEVAHPRCQDHPGHADD